MTLTARAISDQIHSIAYMRLAPYSKSIRDLAHTLNLLKYAKTHLFREMNSIPKGQQTPLEVFHAEPLQHFSIYSYCERPSIFLDLSL